MTQLETVRIGIIGPSWWAKFWHMSGIRSHPAARVMAICGQGLRDADEAAEIYGHGVQGFTDIERMLDTVELDGVIVCTPNDLHYPAAMAALRRGLSVSVEKPVAMTAAQAREMADLAREKGVVGMANFPYRDNPNVRAMRARVDAGDVGLPIHVSGMYHGGFGLQRPPGWRGVRERSGAGILGDLGSHLIDLTRYATGQEFSAVCAHTLTLGRLGADGELTLLRSEDPRAGARNDDSCAFLAEFGSGAQGVLQTSWSAYQGAMGQHQEIEIFGAEGRLHFVSNHAGTFLRGLRIGQTHWQDLTAPGAVPPADGLTEHEDIFRPGRCTRTNTTYRWVEAIRTGAGKVEPDLEDGWRSQQVIDAVILASASRRWVEID